MMAETLNILDLANEFPREDVHWRAQTLTRNKDKALALAYLDARDVMDRLDDVLSPAGWQDKYVETVKGRVICSIGVILPDVGWVWKSDGAGDTAVEGEKGGISDAFKRAAVKWGIGRYLYRMDAVWCPCEVGNNGKWRKWTDDPWNHVRGASRAPSKPKQPVHPQATDEEVGAAIRSIEACDSLEALGKRWSSLNENMRHVASYVPVIEAKDKRKGELA